MAKKVADNVDVEPIQKKDGFQILVDYSLDGNSVGGDVILGKRRLDGTLEYRFERNMDGTKITETLFSENGHPSKKKKTEDVPYEKDSSAVEMNIYGEILDHFYQNLEFPKKEDLLCYQNNREVTEKEIEALIESGKIEIRTLGARHNSILTPHGIGNIPRPSTLKKLISAVEQYDAGISLKDLRDIMKKNPKTSDMIRALESLGELHMEKIDAKRYWVTRPEDAKIKV